MSLTSSTEIEISTSETPDAAPRRARGVAAAIANAVFHATGRRIRDLPIRLEQLVAP